MIKIVTRKSSLTKFSITLCSRPKIVFYVRFFVFFNITKEVTAFFNSQAGGSPGMAIRSVFRRSGENISPPKFDFAFFGKVPKSWNALSLYEPLITDWFPDILRRNNNFLFSFLIYFKKFSNKRLYWKDDYWVMRGWRRVWGTIKTFWAICGNFYRIKNLITVFSIC